MPRVMRSLFLGLVILSCAPENAVAPKLVGNHSAAVLASPELPSVRISEFHYDNISTDAGERIEISGPAGSDLTGWKIFLYNGNGGGTYEPTRTLAATIPSTCVGRGVVVESYAVNGIQNGDPDGIALVDNTGKVVEFLSYEGAFVATNGPAAGMMSKDIGVREAGTEVAGLSLQRYSSGNWTGPRANSFLFCNTEDETPTASVSVSPTAQTLTEGGTQQFVAKAFDAGAHLLPGVAFSWQSSDAAIAKVDVNGLVTSLKGGDVEITAIAPNGMSAVATVHVVGTDPPPVPGLPETRFVELHYDNVGSDINEAIEIEGPAGFSLSGWTVVLYNGSGGGVYSTRPLTGTIPDMCNARGVVALRYEPDGIQNGPDGFALVDAAGKVVEFFSYEGKFTATDGPAVGLSSTLMATDAGVAVSESSVPHSQSMRRAPAGGWQPPAAGISVGACNSGVGPPAPPYQNILFTGRTATDDVPLPVGFQDQIFGTVLNELGDTVRTAISWSSEASVASIDSRGVITALAPGIAVFRASTSEGFTRALLLPTQVATPSTTAVYGNNAEFGEPSDGDASNDFIIRRPQYALSYNRDRGTPNWVSYDLDASHIGSLDRCDCFTFDPHLPADYPRYNTADYTGAAAINGYGIDRGHLARSLDRTTGSLDNANTFYFSNIIPQASDLNQGPWAVLEDSLGKLALNSNKEVYIVAGVAGDKGTVKKEGRITIPAKVWKVAVIMPRDYGLANVHGYHDLEVIAVEMPNDPGVRGVPWYTYKTTVDAIEASSGYDLLANLADPLEAVIESGDHPPTAVLDGPLSGLEGSTLHFDAGKSSDPDGGDALSYLWDFGDGITSTEVSPAHTYADNGSYTVTLSVTDRIGAEDLQTGTVTIANVPPSVKSLTASSALSGETVFATASFGDPGQSDRPWTYVFDWGEGSTSNGSTSDQNTSVGSSRSFTAAGTYTVLFRVTDKDGASSAVRSATFNVQRIPTRLAVNPERINLQGQGNGQVIVTVFGTRSFSGTAIALGSVRIGSVGSDSNGSNSLKALVQDVDNDGNPDLVLHFDRSALATAGLLTAGTTELLLYANLTDGRQIEARGPVNVGIKDLSEAQ
jgi:DNA/RNA endonuclease G (NUC1)